MLIRYLMAFKHIQWLIFYLLCFIKMLVKTRSRRRRFYQDKKGQQYRICSSLSDSGIHKALGIIKYLVKRHRRSAKKNSTNKKGEFKEAIYGFSSASPLTQGDLDRYKQLSLIKKTEVLKQQTKLLKDVKKEAKEERKLLKHQKQLLLQAAPSSSSTPDQNPSCPEDPGKISGASKV